MIRSAQAPVGGSSATQVVAGEGPRRAEICLAAERATSASPPSSWRKWPKAAAKVVDETELLLAVYDFSAEHWIHLMTRTRSCRRSHTDAAGHRRSLAARPVAPTSSRSV